MQGVEPMHVRWVPRCSELSLAYSADGAAVGRISFCEIRLTKESEQEGASKAPGFLLIVEEWKRRRESHLGVD